MVPQAHRDLPYLMAFIHHLKTQYEKHAFRNWQDFIAEVREWFTPEHIQTIDDIVMGWKKMSSYDNGTTLIHLSAALVSLLRLPEYQALSPDQQNLALWIVLYHDVDKEIHRGKRDLTHGFRSAGVTGRGLMRHGFVDAIDTPALLQWATLTQMAMKREPTLNDNVQDNSKLEDIVAGIDSLFGGRNTPAGLIVCGVLLHMSLNVVDDFPQASPLSDDQIRAYITPKLFPLLKVMMLTDSDAWSLFDRDRQPIEREQTLQKFQRVRELLGI